MVLGGLSFPDIRHLSKANSTSAYWTFSGGASLASSKMPGAVDIRSGNPQEVTTAQLAVPIYGLGHYLSSVSLSFQYVAGYTPPAGTHVSGSTLQILLVDATSGATLTQIYQSPVLDAYSYDDFTTYSPPINVSASGLQVPNWLPVAVEFRFTNNDRNLQLALLDPVDLHVRVGWSSNQAPPPPGPPPPPPSNITRPATNAAAVMRGPLLYALPLAERNSVVRTWQPFSNVDLDINSNSTWNYALDLSQQLTFQARGAPAAQPFNISAYPGVILAAGRRLANWTSALSAANEPPVSPVDCGSSGVCGDAEQLVLVPYGSTDLRMSALPWL